MGAMLPSDATLHVNEKPEAISANRLTGYPALCLIAGNGVLGIIRPSIGRPVPVSDFVDSHLPCHAVARGLGDVDSAKSGGNV